MTNLTNYNANRQARTEARMSELLKYTRKARITRQMIIDHFCKAWGVGKTTVSHILWSARRSGRVIYRNGFYKTL